MTYRITKLFDFEASHHLTGLAAGHKCMNNHGHSYKVEIVLEAEELDEHGFVVDYSDLKPFKDYIDTWLDHHDLNEVFPHINPTAENLAKILFDVASEWWTVKEVRVSETAKTWASYIMYRAVP